MAAVADGGMLWKDSIRQQLRERDASHAHLDGVFAAAASFFQDTLRLQQELKECKTENADLALENRDLRSGGSPVKDGRDSKASQREMGRLEKRVSELSEQLSNKSQELLKVTQEKCVLVQQRSEKAHREVETLEKLMKLQEEAEGKDKHIKRLAAEKAELEKDKASLQADLHRKSIELQTCLDEHMALQMEYSVAENDLREIKAERDELVGRVLLMKQVEADKLNSLNVLADRKKADRIQADMSEILDGPDLGPDLMGGRACTKAEMPSRAVFAFDAHEADIYSCTFDRGGSRVATCGSDKKIKLWGASGAKLLNTLSGHSSGVSCIAFDPADEYLISGGYDKTMLMWDLQTGRWTHKLTGHTDKIYACKFTTDSKRVFSCSQDRTIKSWHARRGVLERSLFPGSTCLDLLLDANDTLTTAHFDKTVKLWDARTGTNPAHSIQTDHAQPITALASHPGGSVILTSSKDHSMKAIDVRTLEIVRTYSHDDCTFGTLGCKMTLSPDARYIVAGSDDGKVFVFNYRTGKMEKSLGGSHRAAVTACSWSPMGDLLMTVGRGKQAVLWACTQAS
eukprot:m.486436 g.486436  ORF g.486436 m.486436 type:complete len:570 (+) comp24405_c0_seq1:335-2044(+)